MRINTILLMQKRLLKKNSFIIILLIVIPLIISFRICLKQKSGMLTVALTSQKNTLPSATVKQIFTELHDTVSAINFIDCSSESQARDLVQQKKADTAWIFDSDFDSRIEKSGDKGNVLPVVTIVQGEDTVFLAYIREILCSKIFPYFSYAAYSSYARKNIPALTESELSSQYKKKSYVPDLFCLEASGGQNVSQAFLMSPLRGMLALWLMMCAFAAILYYIQDYNQGCFIWFKNNQSLLFNLKISLIPIFDCAIIMFAAVMCAGIRVSLLYEIASLLLLVLSSILFANLVRYLTINNSIFCASIPIIILVSLVLCPIFLKINSFRPIQLLIPVFYYLNSVYSLYYMWLFVIYTSVLFILNILISLLKMAK